MDDRLQGLNLLLLILSTVSFLIQICAWVWVRRLGGQLEGRDGGTLVGIISFLFGWTLVTQIVVWIGLIYVDITDGDGNPITLSSPTVILFIGSRLAFLVIAFEVWRRLRQFSR